jgi:glucokinase
MILAGDIGGTNARLAFFNVLDGRFDLVSASIFPSREYSGLDKIVTEFVESSKVHPETACFGIAGPVHNGKVETSNLPWIVESTRLAEELNIEKALLINDLEATAWGIAALDAKDLVTLNQIKEPAIGNQAVIAAGTGLGEAGLYWDGKQHHIFASEGGHTDFAPRNDLEVELFCHLTKRFGHVSFERILSGPGLINVYEFLRDSKRGTEQKWLRDEMAQEDPAAVISRAGMEAKDALSEQAVDIFVSVYGAEAGNLALKTKSTGGLYVAGGIAPKMLAKLQTPAFIKAFMEKGRMQHLMETIPVHIITNDKLALLGAARCAVTPA